MPITTTKAAKGSPARARASAAAKRPRMPAKVSETLTKRQQMFAWCWVHRTSPDGGKVRTPQDAARAAGYSAQTARREAAAMLRHPGIAAEIQKLTVERLAQEAPVALEVVRRLMEGARSEYVQLEAAKDMLDRAGFRAPERHDVRVGGEVFVIDLSEPAPRDA